MRRGRARSAKQSTSNLSEQSPVPSEAEEDDAVIPIYRCPKCGLDLGELKELRDHLQGPNCRPEQVLNPSFASLLSMYTSLRLRS